MDTINDNHNNNIIIPNMNSNTTNNLTNSLLSLSLNTNQHQLDSSSPTLNSINLLPPQSMATLKIKNIPIDTTLREAFCIFSLCLDEVTFVDIIREQPPLQQQQQQQIFQTASGSISSISTSISSRSSSTAGENNNNNNNIDNSNFDQSFPVIIAKFTSVKTAQQVTQLLDNKCLFGTAFQPVKVDFIEDNSTTTTTTTTNNNNTRTSINSISNSIPNSSQRSRFLFSDPFNSNQLQQQNSNNSSIPNSNNVHTITNPQTTTATTTTTGITTSTTTTPNTTNPTNSLDTLTSPLLNLSGKHMILMDSQNDFKEYDQLVRSKSSFSNPPTSAPPSANPQTTNLLNGSSSPSISSIIIPPTSNDLSLNSGNSTPINNNTNNSQSSDISWDRRRQSSAFFNNTAPSSTTTASSSSSAANNNNNNNNTSGQLQSPSTPQFTNNTGNTPPTNPSSSSNRNFINSPPFQSNIPSFAQVANNGTTPTTTSSSSTTTNNNNNNTSSTTPQQLPNQIQQTNQLTTQQIPELSLLARVPLPANPADQNPPCNTLYVGNLPPDATEAELRALFSPQKGFRRLSFRTKASQLTNGTNNNSANGINNSNGSSSNSNLPQPNPHHGPMCFVEFEDVAHATRALAELYGRNLPRTNLSNTNLNKGGIRLSFSKNPLGVRGPGQNRRNGNNSTNGQQQQQQQLQQQQQQQQQQQIVGGFNGNSTNQFYSNQQ